MTKINHITYIDSPHVFICDINSVQTQLLLVDLKKNHNTISDNVYICTIQYTYSIRSTYIMYNQKSKSIQTKYDKLTLNYITDSEYD